MIMIFTMAGCGNETKDDPVQTDLINYAETSLPAIKAEENAAVNRYNEVSASINDMERKDIISAFKDEIIPNYTTFYNNLMNVAPATQEVQNLKQTYVDGVKLQLDGMTALADAIKNNDSAAAEEANTQITEGKTKIEQHRSDMITLAGNHNINIKTEGSDNSGTSEAK